ncbi:hypothetical protein FE783_13860 [Paenibacillus mesophilus]|uniref:hypothetical protein n=1 Tax=Paenibacillus mesophilus TaxID=2582849 RepID=UPI00110EE8FD|nr:hypothetical protein [Paenibacillus mesophilus]TMV49580.1 hypothetical protein FE783_13860 [Paenibacillus mesophilus]
MATIKFGKHKDDTKTLSKGSKLPILEQFFTEDKGIMPGKNIYHYGDEYTNLVPGANFQSTIANTSLKCKNVAGLSGNI